jgi:hypothetical protein
MPSVSATLTKDNDIAATLVKDNDVAVTVPSDLTFNPGRLDNLALWLSSDVGVTGDPVSDWDDRSFNDNDATQAVLANRPDFLANQVNSKPSIKGDGLSDILNLGSNITAADFAVFAVMGGDATPNYMMGHAANLYFRYTGTALIWRNSTPHAFDHTNKPLTAGYFLHHLTRRSNSARSYRNNVESLTGAITNAVGLTISKLFSNGIIFGDGAFAELVIYDDTISSANELLVVNYLNSKYALY